MESLRIDGIIRLYLCILKYNCEVTNVTKNFNTYCISYTSSLVSSFIRSIVLQPSIKERVVQ